ncbi:MarR family winged helix-turn-helix transcriptional regulator [Gluconobacter kanchanaburiensis]|uniref:MarR family transcriptional regulator n=1 Tax=Gluconobacter kanchanaburiensis NBRC 103587 TaxID=1307948 RepID=A0A511B921_9PROT|nr:MarR family transcriptional regulator [Gluconobacter kanchanaburiensis]MBF0862586.1 MarR family transcriptional regulator [Gluconobacter kanchanaburiensis]GEK96919.1 MarR family transcriptional regulator [Gluconobacter kanchanaburiensis NBRC 103587]
MSALYDPSILRDSSFHDMGLTFHVLRLSSLWRAQLDRLLRPKGMTLATMRPMAYLMVLGDGVKQSDLASVMGVDSSALVRVLDHLGSEELISREPDPQDRRSNLLVLTAAGRERCRQFHRIAADLEARLVEGLPEEAAADMRNQLGMMEGKLFLSGCPSS